MTAWNTVPLGEVADIESGTGFPVHLQGRKTGKYPFAKVGDISRIAKSGGSELADADNYVDESDLSVLRAKAIPSGSVVFAKIGEAIRLNYRAITARPMLVDNNVMSVQPKPAVLDTRYLYHFLQQFDLYPLANSTAVPSIRKSTLTQVRIPVPPLTEQRRLSDLLDRGDALTAARRTGISLLGSLARSIFFNMFDDSAGRWPEVTVKDIAAPERGSMRTGPFGSQLLHSEFVDSGIAVLGIDNAVADEFRWAQRRYITEEKYQKLKRYTVQPGDVIITIMGTCGRCAVVPDDIPTAINTKHLCCITLDRDKCLPEYLHSYFLWHPAARSYLHRTAKGAIMSGLNMSIIAALPVTVPPVELQRKYVEQAAAIAKLKDRQVAHLSELGTLFASLQHQAFTGNL